MSENLGAGFYLDQSFDLSVDETGDMKSASGISELEKDLSLQMAFQLREYLGTPPSENIKSKVASDAITLAELDTRVDSVESIDVNYNDDHTTIMLEMSVRTNTNDEYRLVIEV